jgi:hypothetical protein
MSVVCEKYSETRSLTHHLHHRRLINLPPQLAPHLHKALFSEIQAAVEDVRPRLSFPFPKVEKNVRTHAVFGCGDQSSM